MSKDGPVDEPRPRGVDTNWARDPHVRLLTDLIGRRTAKEIARILQRLDADRPQRSAAIPPQSPPSGPRLRISNVSLRSPLSTSPLPAGRDSKGTQPLTEFSNADPLLTFAEAARYLSPTGALGARAVRSEVARGRLQSVKVAGKVFVHLSELQRYDRQLRGTPCRDAAPGRSSSFAGSIAATTPSTSFAGTSAAAGSSVQQARMTSERLKTLSRRSSPAAPASPSVRATPAKSR